jgi:outer membrane protein TolC
MCKGGIRIHPTRAGSCTVQCGTQAQILCGNADNPTLAAAFASLAQARVVRDQARAALFPTVDLNATVTRNRESANAPLRPAGASTYYNSNMIGGTVSYELDLWGRVRDEVAIGEANGKAAAADLESARLSLHTQLLSDYIQLRSLDRSSAILEDAVKAYLHALTITQQRHDAGIAPGLDVSQAETQHHAARSQAEHTLVSRALMEQGIAALPGVSASTFSIQPALVDIKLPHIRTDVPAALLQRRPDIAAAERHRIAANAVIGVARGILSGVHPPGAGSFESTTLSS